MQRCYDTKTFPGDWSRAEVVGIFKKGAHHLPSNYRPISLLEACYKLFARMIASRLQEEHLGRSVPHQTGH
eukprot:14938995-Alexandrium_andersonii.AAC.1